MTNALKQPRCVKGIALYDSPGGIGHTLLGLTSPMLGRDAARATAALFFTYEAQRVMQGTKTALHAVGNLLEFALGLALYYGVKSL